MLNAVLLKGLEELFAVGLLHLVGKDFYCSHSLGFFLPCFYTS